MELDNATIRAFGLVDEGETIFNQLWATEVTQISKHLGMRKVRNPNGRYTLELVLDENTGIKEIQNFWYKISDTRDKLRELQGRELGAYYLELIRVRKTGDYTITYKSVISEKRVEFLPIKRRPSPLTLTQDANFDALVFMVAVAKEPNASDFAKLAQNYFQGLLSSFNFNKADIEKMQSDAIEKIKAGHCPWDIKDTPIPERKMREKVRYIIDAYHLPNLNNVDSKNVLLGVYQLFLIRKYWSVASDLLQKTHLKTYKKYEDRLNARTSEILFSLTPNSD